jgi:WD repeat-containing protein 23
VTRWTITDTTLSLDQRLLVYAAISPVAFVVDVGSSGDPVSDDNLPISCASHKH